LLVPLVDGAPDGAPLGFDDGTGEGIDASLLIVVFRVVEEVGC